MSTTKTKFKRHSKFFTLLAKSSKIKRRGDNLKVRANNKHQMPLLQMMVRIVTNLMSLLTHLLADLESFSSDLLSADLGPHLEERESINGGMIFTLIRNNEELNEATRQCFLLNSDLFYYDGQTDVEKLFSSLGDTEIWTGIRYLPKMKTFANPEYRPLPLKTISDVITYPSVTPDLNRDKVFSLVRNDNRTFSVTAKIKSATLPYACVKKLPAHFSQDIYSEFQRTLQTFNERIKRLIVETKNIQDKVNSNAALARPPEDLNELTFDFQSFRLAERFPEYKQDLKNSYHLGFRFNNLEAMIASLEWYVRDLRSGFYQILSKPTLINEFANLDVPDTTLIKLYKQSDTEIYLQLGDTFLNSVWAEFLYFSAYDIGFSVFLLLSLLISAIKFCYKSKEPVMQTYYINQVPRKRKSKKNSKIDLENSPYHVSTAEQLADDSRLKWCFTN